MMRIGGFHKQSFIDWAGKTTAVVFTKGCNFRCGYCHNPDLVLPHLLNNAPDISEKEIFDYLLNRKNWIDGVVITGGEPTLQLDLEKFIVGVKRMGYAVKLDTNGSSPSILEKLIKQKLVDYVAMDVKTSLELDRYQEICGIKDPQLLMNIESSIQILKDSPIEYQLRTTIIPSFHTKEIVDNLERLFSYCNYQLQDFRATK